MIDLLATPNDDIMNEYRILGCPEFEDYSPAEIQLVVNHLFMPGCPVQLLELSDEEYKAVPILNQIKYLAEIIEREGELKLTNKGFLPVSVVKDIYSQGFIKDTFVETGLSKLYKETDSNITHLTRILIELTGIVKKRNKKLSLTKKGKGIIQNNYELLKLLFTTFGKKFNWGYFDGYEDEVSVGQYGFGFTLILLRKYGDEELLDFEYAEKYLYAFPLLLEFMEPPRFGSLEDQFNMCYTIRTFDRFLKYFGLIEISSKNNLARPLGSKIIKTPLFDKMIKVLPPRLAPK